MKAFEDRARERAREDVAAFTADPFGWTQEKLLEQVRMTTPRGRVGNLLVLDTPQVPAQDLVAVARRQELENGRTVYELDCAGASGLYEVLEKLTETLTGSLPSVLHGKLIGYDYISHLLREFPAEEIWPRIIVTGIANPGDAHALFGRLRDEMWQLPAQWLVSGDVNEVERYLVPPANSFFEAVLPNRAVLAGVYGRHPHPYS